MATHFVCHSSEPLPHRYPTGATQNSHGAVSQYEVFNSPAKPHSQFPPPGWDFSLTSEEDSLPLIQPFPKASALTGNFRPDPDLCITPERPRFTNRSQLPIVNPDPLLCITPDKSQLVTPLTDDSEKKSKQRVRFDVSDTTESELDITDYNPQGRGPSAAPGKRATTQPYKPELYGQASKSLKECEDEHENCKTLKSKTVQYQISGEPNCIQLPDDQTLLIEDPYCDRLEDVSVLHMQKPRVQTVGKHKAVTVIREKEFVSSKEDPIVACRPEGSKDKDTQKRKVKVLRENQYGPKLTDYTYPFRQDGLEGCGGEEHTFARPEFNSTLRLKQEADNLKECSIDVAQALQRKLKLSEATRSDINEKAASRVNTDTTYKGLVSLEIPVEDLVTQVSEQKYCQTKTVKSSKPKDAREPDLMAFFSSEMVKESVTFDLAGVPSPSQELSTAGHLGAFDLYRHNRVWESRDSH